MKVRSQHFTLELQYIFTYLNSEMNTKQLTAWSELCSLTTVQHNILTVTISSISWRDINPLPSKSYMLKAHLSFCSNFPLDVTDNAHRNSRKSIVPSPFASNVRKTCSANWIKDIFIHTVHQVKLKSFFINSLLFKYSI